MTSSVHPVRSYTDASGVGWLVLSNGGKVRLPAGAGGGNEVWVGDDIDLVPDEAEIFIDTSTSETPPTNEQYSHNALAGRDASDTHPTYAITGLDTALAGKASTSALAAKEDKAAKGQPSGYAPLDAGSKVPSANLPAYPPVITDHSGLTGRSAADQHPIGAVTGLQTALDGKEAIGLASALDAQHVAHPNPHDQYLTEAEGDAQYAPINHMHPGQTARRYLLQNPSTTAPPAGWLSIIGSGGADRVFRVPKVDADGVAMTLVMLLPGDGLAVTDEPSTPPITSFARYAVTSDVRDEGGWWGFDAQRTDSAGVQTPPANGTPVRVILTMSSNATGAVVDHGALTGLSDPDHPIAAVQGLQGALDGKEAAGTAASAVAAHAAAADPHTGYQKESERGAASGYASLDGTTKVPVAQLPTGTTASTVALGDAPAAAITAHEAAADPHHQYALQTGLLQEAMWHVDAGAVKSDRLTDLTGRGRDAIFGAGAAAPVVLPWSGEDWFTLPGDGNGITTSNTGDWTTSVTIEGSIDFVSGLGDLTLHSSSGYGAFLLMLRSTGEFGYYYDYTAPNNVEVRTGILLGNGRHTYKFRGTRTGYELWIDGVSMKVGTHPTTMPAFAWGNVNAGSGMAAHATVKRYRQTVTLDDAATPKFILDPRNVNADYTLITNTGTAGGDWDIHRAATGYKTAVVDRPLVLFGGGQSANSATRLPPSNGRTILTALRRFGNGEIDGPDTREGVGSPGGMVVWAPSNEALLYVLHGAVSAAMTSRADGQMVFGALLGTSGGLRAIVDGALSYTQPSTGQAGGLALRLASNTDGSANSTMEFIAAAIWDRALTDSEIAQVSRELLQGQQNFATLEYVDSAITAHVAAPDPHTQYMMMRRAADYGYGWDTLTKEGQWMLAPTDTGTPPVAGKYWIVEVYNYSPDWTMQRAYYPFTFGTAPEVWERGKVTAAQQGVEPMIQNWTAWRRSEAKWLMDAHEAAADPHTGYQKESEKGAVSGYAPLDAGSKVPAANLPTYPTVITDHNSLSGRTAADAHPTSAVTGLDSALAGKSDTSHTHSGLTPGGAAGGDLTGTYPNPTIAAGVIVDADINGSAAIAQSKISGLSTSLAGKSDTSHTHTGTTISALDAGDTTTGVFAIGRIPTGITSATAALGNHTHADLDISGIYSRGMLSSTTVPSGAATKIVLSATSTLGIGLSSNTFTVNTTGFYAISCVVYTSSIVPVSTQVAVLQIEFSSTTNIAKSQWVIGDQAASVSAVYHLTAGNTFYFTVYHNMGSSKTINVGVYNVKFIGTE